MTTRADRIDRPEAGGAPSIRLLPIDDPLARALDRSAGEFESRYRASLGKCLDLTRPAVAQTLALQAKVPREAPWLGYLAVDAAAGEVVGTCAFKAAPDGDGRVEIAYFTFPEFEGRGYASAMARALVRLAGESGAAPQVIAHTLPERNASTRVLEKCGFALLGEVHDPEDGRVWRWVLRSGA
jgi:RimJ/RimL family protein N-acetyltransferase